MIRVRNWNIKECENLRGAEDVTVKIHSRCCVLLSLEREWE